MQSLHCCCAAGTRSQRPAAPLLPAAPLQYASLKEVAVQREGEACTGAATATFEQRADAEAAVAALDGQAAIPADAEAKLKVGGRQLRLGAAEAAAVRAR